MSPLRLGKICLPLWTQINQSSFQRETNLGVKRRSLYYTIILEMFITCVEAELKNHECHQKNALEAMQLLKSTASPRSLKCFACVIIKENWNVDEEVELNTGGCPVKVRNVGSDGDGKPSKNLPSWCMDCSWQAMSVGRC